VLPAPFASGVLILAIERLRQPDAANQHVLVREIDRVERLVLVLGGGVLLPGTGEAGVREKRCLALREAFSAVRETRLALRERRSALH
jgi:hypothetical protein